MRMPRATVLVAKLVLGACTMDVGMFSTRMHNFSRNCNAETKSAREMLRQMIDTFVLPGC